MISVQTEDFSLEQEYQKLRTEAGDVGAIVTFTGIVRELYDGSGDKSRAAKTDRLYLEHYPGMTETSLARMGEAGEKKWPAVEVGVIQRVGE